MKTEKIEIKGPDGICDAYASYPGEAAYPAILFFMDAYGPRAYLYEMAEKLAAEGYYVLMPNMFYRVRPAPVVDVKFPVKPEAKAEAVEKIMSLFKVYSPQKALEDIDLCMNYLKTQKRARTAKMGATGYCMGGGLAFRTAARYPQQIAAAACFHGGNLATDTPDSPHLLLSQVKAELYFAHADNDRSMQAGQIERLQEALQKSGLRFKNEVYAEKEHGFTMADLPAGDAAAIERHWHELRGLFARNLQ